MSTDLGASSMNYLDYERETRVPKVLVIDDDPLFCALMARLGASVGIDVEAHGSIVEVEPFSRLSEFDGAIFDYYLGRQVGMDIMSNLKPFFENMPTLLVSADSGVKSLCSQRACGEVPEFAHKSLGAVRILERMKDLLQKRKTA